jgi:hypothetical protein
VSIRENVEAEPYRPHREVRELRIEHAHAGASRIIDSINGRSNEA